MRTKELLQELIGLVEAFDTSVPEGESINLDDFISFLNKLPVQSKDNKTIINISKNVSLLHRYSKFYLKKVLKDSMLQTIDEYSYLISLFYNESLTKTELNNMNAMEKTSGNEVIRRLLKANLIKQQRDQSDKRSMRVSITGQGKTEIKKIFPGLNKAAIILSGPLPDGEKESLNRSLSNLCDYHHNIFIGQKNSSIDDILSEISE
ncbi:MAG TPA: MarR family winged helix-turn-helix transcriptional regulator [Bacteroidales bacterium]|nr:MarR family winged helix-turn-helix transcriptional regulator [Bacteroidales bacterium]HPT20548.1 MarR family winged helix-turn-helix transcriptional regulator [Bacteroidales bacterium]